MSLKDEEKRHVIENNKGERVKKMKVKDIRVEEIFVIDNTMTKPKLKLEQGYLDMTSLMKWNCREDVEGRILGEQDILKVRMKWRMTFEKFKDYKQTLIRRYIEEVK